METLKKLLTEKGLADFLEKKFTKFPASGSLGPGHFSSLLDWQILEKIFDKKKSVLRIIKDGAMTKDYASENFQEALSFYNSGHTLLVKNAECSDSNLESLANDFQDSFYTPVDIQIYCTPEGHNAFGWHYDVEEVFILQVKGCKEYSIRQNTHHPLPLVDSIPKDLGYEKEKSELSLKVSLEEGDWLYIPSGWWHRALTKKESMHISIGLMPRSAVDIAGYLSNYLVKTPFWRQRIPLHLEFASLQEEKSFYREAFMRLAEDLKNKFCEDEFMNEFFQNARRPPFSNSLSKNQVP